MARVTGRNLNVFSVASSDLIANVRECTINRSFDSQENRALLDAFHYQEPVIEDWSIDFTVVATDSLDFATASKTNAAFLQGLVGTSVAVTVETGSAANNGVRYAGTGLLQSGRHEVPTTDVQAVSFTIVPQSALTPTQL